MTTFVMYVCASSLGAYIFETSVWRTGFYLHYSYLPGISIRQIFNSHCDDVSVGVLFLGMHDTALHENLGLNPASNSETDEEKHVRHMKQRWLSERGIIIQPRRVIAGMD